MKTTHASPEEVLRLGRSIRWIQAFLEHEQSTYILSGKDFYRLGATSSVVHRDIPARRWFRRWLRMHEGGRGTIRLTTTDVYKEFHGAHLQRLLLRRCQLPPINSVVAEGMAT